MLVVSITWEVPTVPLMIDWLASCRITTMYIVRSPCKNCLHLIWTSNLIQWQIQNLITNIVNNLPNKIFYKFCWTIPQESCFSRASWFVFNLSPLTESPSVAVFACQILLDFENIKVWFLAVAVLLFWNSWGKSERDFTKKVNSTFISLLRLTNIRDVYNVYNTLSPSWLVNQQQRCRKISIARQVETGGIWTKAVVSEKN